MAKLFKDWYIFDKFKQFLNRYSIEETLFIGALGFESRSIGSFEAMIEHKHINTDQINFLFFYLDSQQQMKQELEELGIEEIELNDIEIKKNHNINIIGQIKKKRKLNLNLFKYQRIDDNGQLVGHNEVFEKISKELDKKIYENVFLDVSAFPRSVFIPLIKKLYLNKKVENLFLIWVNKGGLTYENNVLNYERPIFLPTFDIINTDQEKMIFWLPILHFETIPIDLIRNQKYFENNASFYPLLTFPNMWPEEINSIIQENSKFFTGNIFQNDKIIHVPLNNPFEFFNRIREFSDSKYKIFKDDFSIIISPFGTKAQSIGACLAAIFQKNVTLLTCHSVKYNDDIENLPIEERKKAFIALIKSKKYY